MGVVKLLKLAQVQISAPQGVLLSMPNPLSWAGAPDRPVLRCPWTLGPSERPFLQGLVISAGAGEASQSHPLLERASSALCHDLLESLWLEMSHTEGGIHQEQCDLALQGTFPQGSRHFPVFEGQRE